MLDEFDLHITALLFILSLLVLMGCSVFHGPVLYLQVVPLFLLPQAPILVRAFVDYQAFGRKKMPYLISNEIQVILLTLLWLLSIRLFFA